MGILNGRPRLESDELIRWKAPANRVLSGWHTSGGQLVVANRRVFFQPNRFDTASARKPWACSLGSVDNVEAVEPGGATLTGGLRKRLGVRYLDGCETFIIPKLDERLPEIRKALGRI